MKSAQSLDDLEEDFATDLRQDLSQLASRAPMGPTGDQVLSALRHRKVVRRRWSMASASIVTAVLCFVVLQQMQRQQQLPESSPITAVTDAPADFDDSMTKTEPVPSETSVHPTAPPTATTANPLMLSTALTLATIMPQSVEEHVEGDQADQPWNLSLSLTLASPSESEMLLPVMELSLPRW